MKERKHGNLVSRSFRAALVLIVVGIVAAAGVLALAGNLRERSLVTGAARWIWFSLDIDEAGPLRFYAQRDFTLETVPASAKAKLFIDRRGSLIINGSRFVISEQRPGSRLRVLEVAPALVTGVNRTVIEAESPTGAGGILFCLDLPQGRRVVSDRSWRVSLSQAVLARGGGAPAGVWGKPPMYPWGYPKE
jgi:hypothetical protein